MSTTSHVTSRSSGGRCRKRRSAVDPQSSRTSVRAIALETARRFAILLAICGGVVLVVAVPVGLLAGQGFNRSLSLGFYLLGSFLAVAGFFIGNRGPLRAREETDRRLGRGLRRASLGEQADTITISAIFVALGFTLIVIGILVDSNHELI